MASWRMCQLLLRVAPRAAALPRNGYLIRAMSSGGTLGDEGHVTGLEKIVLEATKRGEDPFDLLPKSAPAGTKEKPYIVRSVNKYRMVGCVCEEDNSAVIWFWIHEGEVHRCPECGACYKLVHHELPH